MCPTSGRIILFFWVLANFGFACVYRDHLINVTNWFSLEVGIAISVYSFYQQTEEKNVLMENY